MPRKSRVYSTSGIYHVMVRGINRENIFLDEIDFLKMEKILRSLTKPADNDHQLCKIYAYCIMSNHLHLLMAELDEPISDVVKRLGIEYASYFNRRRKRSGPLFEGRFRSEPVDEYDYFATLLAYIHYNPVKAGIVEHPDGYKWSSWHEYELPVKTDYQGICEQSVPFRKLTRAQVKKLVLNAEEPKLFCSPLDKGRCVDIEEAERILKRMVPEKYNGMDLKELPKVERLEISVKAADFGITYFQLATLLDLNNSAIFRQRQKSR